MLKKLKQTAEAKVHVQFFFFFQLEATQPERRHGRSFFFFCLEIMQTIMVSSNLRMLHGRYATCDTFKMPGSPFRPSCVFNAYMVRQWFIALGYGSHLQEEMFRMDQK